MSDEDRGKRPDEECDDLSEEDLAKVSGGAAFASVDPAKTRLKLSKRTNPVVNVGMEKNDAEEHPGLGNRIRK